MRLLVVSPAPGRGGAEEYALKVARAALSAGYEVEAALPAGPGTRSLIDDLHRSNIPTHGLPCIDPWPGGTPASTDAVRSATRVTVGLLRRIRPDIVHVSLPWPPFASFAVFAPAVLGIPAVVVFQLVPDQFQLTAPRSAYWAARLRRQQWVTVSNHGRRLVAKGFGVRPRTIDVIPNGARPPADKCLASDRRDTARHQVRASLGLSETERIVLSVGRLDPQKGLAELVDVMKDSVACRGDATLLIAGEGALRADIARRVADSEGKIRLLGRRSDVSLLLLAADLFVFPSRFEGFPFALIEAMAHELPVVATRFGGVEEILYDEVNGLVVPLDDPGALRQAVERLLDEPHDAKRLAVAARSRAHDFSELRMLTRTLDVLGQATRRNRRQARVRRQKRANA